MITAVLFMYNQSPVFRFANWLYYCYAISDWSLDIWTSVIFIRNGYLLKYMNSWSASVCFLNSSMVILPLEHQEAIMKDLEEQYQYLHYQHFNYYDYNFNLEKTFNLSNEFVRAAGEMFIYSFLCPKFMFDWTKFYVELLENSPPDIIVQTLTRIIIMGKKNDDKAIENVARKILMKISEKISLQFQSIEAFNKNYTANVSDVVWTKGIKKYNTMSERLQFAVFPFQHTNPNKNCLYRISNNHKS